MLRRTPIVPIVLSLVMAATVVRADEAGQADLDRAVAAKLDAESLRDLNNVISLCDQALTKGLSKESTVFAKQLLGATLLERGVAIGESIFKQSPPSPQWPQLRKMSLADLERSIQLDPEQADAHMLIARLQLLPGGERKRAMTALEEALRLTATDKPKHSDALILRASAQEDVPKQLADLDEAVTLVPENPKPLRARGAIKLAMKKPDEALADFDAALRLDPKDAPTHEARGLALATMEKWDDARKSYDEALKLKPDNTSSLLQRGRVNILAGDFKAADLDFSQALKVDPDNIAALLLRAEARNQLDKREPALEDLNKALELRPGLVPALRARATLLAAADKLQQAIVDLELVRKLEPDDKTTQLQLAALYVGGGKVPKAIETYNAILESDPKSWLAHRGRADAFLTAGQQRAAIADYEEALKQEPKDSGSLNNLAWVLATSPDKAIRDGKRAIELATEAAKATDYKAAHILSTLAAGYAETGDFKTAVTWSKKALEVSDEKLREPLTKELKSYEAEKPWREVQGASAEAAPAEKAPTKEAQTDKAPAKESNPPSGGTKANPSSPLK
jgi:tetratricopeptide (TPR) repeat protein